VGIMQPWEIRKKNESERVRTHFVTFEPQSTCAVRPFPVLPVCIWSRLARVATADTVQSEVLGALFRKSDINNYG